MRPRWGNEPHTLDHDMIMRPLTHARTHFEIQHNTYIHCWFVTYAFAYTYACTTHEYRNTQVMHMYRHTNIMTLRGNSDHLSWQHQTSTALLYIQAANADWWLWQCSYITLGTCNLHWGIPLTYWSTHPQTQHSCDNGIPQSSVSQNREESKYGFKVSFWGLCVHFCHFHWVAIAARRGWLSMVLAKYIWLAILYRLYLPLVVKLQMTTLN